MKNEKLKKSFQLTFGFSSLMSNFENEFWVNVFVGLGSAKHLKVQNEKLKLRTEVDQTGPYSYCKIYYTYCSQILYYIQNTF